ncbi:MAG: hypothetical protein HY716_05460 [Planctomycetes bacterium]|nr:hypothetical protein [Planctomycetota bacterium]
MRKMVLLAAAAFAAGCKPPAYDVQEMGLTDQLHRFFNNLNSESALWAIDSKRPRYNADEDPSLGRTLNQYQWHPAGLLHFDVECSTCHARQIVVEYYGVEVKCPACGAGTMEAAIPDRTMNRPPLIAANLTYENLKKLGRTKPMLEIVTGQNTPIVAVVRYVRRQWKYDPMARVEVSPKALERVPISTLPEPTKPDASQYYAGGYHRPDAVFIGTIAFVYDAGSMRQIDPESVRKLDAGETVGIASMRLGPAPPIEDAIRPWNEPRAHRVTDAWAH